MWSCGAECVVYILYLVRAKKNVRLRAHAKETRERAEVSRNHCVVTHTCLTTLSTTSTQKGLPAELKHISKRRKRNQYGIPLVGATEQG